MLKKLLVSVATVSVLFAGNACLPGSSAHFKNHLVPKVVKAVGQTGISAAQTKNDLLVFTKIHKNLAKIEENDEFKDVEVKVYESRVILLGKVPNKQAGKKVVDVAWNTKGVKEVANETFVSSGALIVPLVSSLYHYWVKSFWSTFGEDKHIFKRTVVPISSASRWWILFMVNHSIV